MKGYRAESGYTHKDLENDTDRSSDLSYLDSIERMNREIMRSKNVLDNMWFQNIGQKSVFDYVLNNGSVLTPINTVLSSYREINSFAVESAGSRSICTFD